MKGILGVPGILIKDQGTLVIYESYILEASYYTLLNTGQYGTGLARYYDKYMRILNHVRPKVVVTIE